MGTLTSANAVFTLTAAGLYTTPQQIQGFGVDDAFETAEVENAEIVLGVDAVMSVGWLPVLNKLSVTLQANSESMPFFDRVYQTENQNMEKIRLDGVISIPSTGQTFTLIKGYQSKFVPTPPAKKILQPRKFEITFQTIASANQ